jgi:hypothetical protein
MWEPRRLTTLLAFTGDSFTFFIFIFIFFYQKKRRRKVLEEALIFLSPQTVRRDRVQFGCDQTVPRPVVMAGPHKLQFTNFIMPTARCGFLSQQSRMSCCRARALIRFKTSRPGTTVGEQRNQLWGLGAGRGRLYHLMGLDMVRQEEGATVWLTCFPDIVCQIKLAPGRT